METENRSAKVGEHIQIINASPIKDQHYETGDVLTVLAADAVNEGDVCVGNVPGYVDYEEYEVVVEVANVAPANTITLDDKPLVFVQNEGYTDFDVYHRGELVSGVRTVSINAGMAELTTHVIEYISAGFRNGKGRAE